MPRRQWTEEEKQAAREREIARRRARYEEQMRASEPNDPSNEPNEPLNDDTAPEDDGRVAEPPEEEGAPEQDDQSPDPRTPPVVYLKTGREPLRDYEAEMVRAKARAMLDEEIEQKTKRERDKFLKEELDKELLRQRREAGLLDHKDDLIEFLVNVAPYSPGLTIDGHVYPHGSWLTKIRLEYDSYREIMANSWISEERAGNPNKKFEEWRQAANIGNPMLREHRMQDGTYTLGFDHTVQGARGTVIGKTTYHA